MYFQYYILEIFFSNIMKLDISPRIISSTYCMYTIISNSVPRFIDREGIFILLKDIHFLTDDLYYFCH